MCPGTDLGETAVLRSVAPETAAAGQPDLAGGAFDHAADHAELVGRRPQRLEAGGRRRKALQRATRGGHPQPAVAGAHQGGDAVGREAAWLVRTMAPGLDVVGGGIQPAQPAGHRADPQRAVLAARQRRDVAVAQRMRIPAIAVVGAEGVAVEAVEPILGTDPDETLLILQDRPRSHLRQPAGDAEIAKAHGIDRSRRGALAGQREPAGEHQPPGEQAAQHHASPSGRLPVRPGATRGSRRWKWVPRPSALSQLTLPHSTWVARL